MILDIGTVVLPSWEQAERETSNMLAKKSTQTNITAQKKIKGIYYDNEMNLFKEVYYGMENPCYRNARL